METPGVNECAATVAEMTTVVARALDRLDVLLRSDVDPGLRVTPEWRVRDVAAHMAAGAPAYLGMARGMRSPVESLTGIAAWNAATLSVMDETDLGRLADDLGTHINSIVEEVKGLTGDGRIPWHGGCNLPAPTFLAVVAAELVMHGRDIALAAKRAWPISRADAGAFVRAEIPLFPLIVDRDAASNFDATVGVRLRGESLKWNFRFSAGELEVTPATGRRPECVVFADPAAFVLSIYGRLSPIRATLTGQVLAGGRRPWLALRFGELFLDF